MEFDVPCFKVLASNDTSSAPGHQGGVVIPKGISEFFPALELDETGNRPTVEAHLDVELFAGDDFLAATKTRYQYQTWGRTRRFERRLTSNLGPIRDLASAGDILLFERSLDSPLKMRIRLVAQGSKEHASIVTSANGKNWGVLEQRPVSNTDFQKAEEEMAVSLAGPFQMFASSVVRKASRVMRIAREKTFKKAVLENFSCTCAVSGRMLVSRNVRHGLDAAHIIPLARNGTNDIRNGLALSKDLHWAFDEGLFGIAAGRVAVSPIASADVRNAYLSTFEGKPLLEAKNVGLAPHMSALDWHLLNVFQRE